jgi:hypothetical protein
VILIGPDDIFWLAQEAKRALDRGDYLALRKAGLADINTLAKQEGGVLRSLIKTDFKIVSVREAIKNIQAAKTMPEKDLPMPSPAPEDLAGAAGFENAAHSFRRRQRVPSFMFLPSRYPCFRIEKFFPTLVTSAGSSFFKKLIY